PEAAAVAATLAGRAGRVGTSADIAPADLVINATPLGMHGSTDLPLDVDRLHTGQIVVDLVYDPLETPLLAAARARGAEGHNGLSMLVFQAGVAFELWTGVDAPIAVMLGAASEAVSQRRAVDEIRRRNH